MSYLLDTSIVIGYLRKVPSVGEFINGKIDKGVNFYLSSVSIGELYAGIYSSGDKPKGIHDVQIFMQSEEIDLVDFDLDMAEEFGRMVAYLKEKGTPVPKSDVMLGATANVLGVPIATMDKRHFPVLEKVGVYVKII